MSCNCGGNRRYPITGLNHPADSKPEKAMEKELKNTKNTKAPKTNDTEEKVEE